jgi:CD36 family
VLNEVGPYAYKQRMERVGLKFSENDSVVSYKIATHYYFSKGKNISEKTEEGLLNIKVRLK